MQTARWVSHPTVLVSMAALGPAWAGVSLARSVCSSSEPESDPAQLLCREPRLQLAAVPLCRKKQFGSDCLEIISECKTLVPC